MATTASTVGLTVPTSATTNDSAILEKRTIQVITDIGYKAFIFLVIFGLSTAIFGKKQTKFSKIAAHNL